MSLNCDGWKWQNPYLKNFVPHMWLHWFSIIIITFCYCYGIFKFLPPRCSNWLPFFPFSIDAFKLFLSRIFCLFFFVLFVVLVEIKQCLNFQCWTIKIIKNSGVLFYFLFHEKTILCDQFSYFDKVCNDEEKFIVFNCFFIRIYLERKKKIIVIISLCSHAH